MSAFFSSLSPQTQKVYSYLFNTQEINPTQQDVKQEDIEKRADFPPQGNSRSIRTDLYQLFNQRKPNLSLLAGAAAALLYAIRLEGKVHSQSTQIAALKEEMAAFHTKQFYMKDEKLSSEYIKDNCALSKYNIRNQFGSSILEVTENKTINAIPDLIILKESNLHLTLPAANSLYSGMSIRLFGSFTRSYDKNGQCLIKVADNSQDIIDLGNDHKKSSIPLNTGEYLQLVANSEKNLWYAANRNAALGLAPSFEGVLNRDGWQQLPTGMILQWGFGATDQNGFVKVNFPKKFPTEFIGIHGTHEGTGPAITIEKLSFERSTSEVTLHVTNHNRETGQGWIIRWFAIGY